MDAKDLKNFKNTAEELAKAAADLKNTNEQTNKTAGEIKLELEKVNDKINTQETELKELREREAKKNRLGFGGDSGEDIGYKNEFVNRFMRKGNENGLQKKAGSISVPGDGGYLVPEEMDKEILRLLKDEVVMRQECRVIQVGSEEYKKLVKSSGASGGWVGETDARPATDTPSWVKLGATFGEIYANPQVSQRMLDDTAFDVASDIVTDIAEEFGELEEHAFTVGDGTNKPKGILAHTMSTDDDTARAFGEIQKIISSTAGAFTADDLITLQMTLKKKHRKNAKWMLSNSSLLKVRTMKDSNGNYIWQAGLELDRPSTLLGKAIAENEQMPDVVANALSIAFADFKRSYLILDRKGMGMLRDPFTNKPYVGFYTTKRCGGMLADSNAIKVMQIAS